MHFAAANLGQVNFDQVKRYMVVYLLLLLLAACMHFATAASCIKLLEFYAFFGISICCWLVPW